MIEEEIRRRQEEYSFAHSFPITLSISDSDFHNYSHFWPSGEALAATQGVQVDGRGSVTISFVKQYLCVSATKSFLVFETESDFLIITPLRYWSDLNGRRSAGTTAEILVKPFRYQCQTRHCNDDDEIIDQKWKYTTKSGEKDWRYKSNTLIYAVQRYGVELYLEDKSSWCFGGFSKQRCHSFSENCRVVVGNTNNCKDGNVNGEEANTKAEVKQGVYRRREWFEVLGVHPTASRQEIVAARNKLVRQLHPDRLKSIEGLSPDIEQYANDRLAEVNVAYDEAMRPNESK